MTDDQSAVIAFLTDPATHGGVVPMRIDTHGAVVVLAGETAYKLKRAVVYPFLDYGTLPKRRAALEQELAINRPLAPSIYREVLAVTQGPDGRFRLGGEGDVVDYVLCMNRFDERQTLDQVVSRRPLTEREVDMLAAAIATAHGAAPPADAATWIGDLATYIQQNDEALRGFPELIAAEDVDRLTAAARAAWERQRPLLERRGEAGLVRRCHGDLHLGNIVLVDDRPTLFDAIEFDPRIAAGDVLYDLAFLLMDLCQRDQVASANRLLNRYLAAARRPADLEGLAALPLFLHLRAAIRAKVTAARLAFAAGVGHAVLAEARHYLGFATDALLPRRARLVAVGGLSGTGKTVLAHGLAPLLGAPPGAVILRSDVERKALFGVAETAPLPPDAYGDEVTARVYARLADGARRALAAGVPVVCDAVYARPEERRALAAVAAAAGVPFDGLWLELPLVERLARVSGRKGDASDAGPDVVRLQEQYDPGPMDWVRVDATGTPEQVLERARLRLPEL
jgi:aminoglycoside phosphotransferase family enzyme/predicted kinase